MTSNHSRYFVTTWRTAATVLLAALLSACAKGPLCPELGTCGGDPIGTWESTAQTTTCMDGPYFTPTTIAQPGAPLDLTLYGRPSPVAGQAPSPPTLAEWCQDLTLQKDVTKLLVSVPSFAFQDPLFSNFRLALNSDLSYTVGFSRAGRFGQYYSEACLTEFGQNPNDCVGVQATILAADPNGQFLKNPTCSAVAGGGCDCAYDAAAGRAHVGGESLTCAVTGLVLNTDMQIKAQTNSDTTPRYTNIVCGISPGRDGCDCGFDVNYRTDQTGVYKKQGNVLITYPQGAAVDYSSQATYCRQGDTLDLSGYGSAYILNQPSLRTIQLHRRATP